MPKHYVFIADVPLLKRSLDLWNELNTFYQAEVRGTIADDDPESLVNMCGGVMIGNPESEVVSGVMRSIREHNMPHEVLVLVLVKLINECRAAQANVFLYLCLFYVLIDCHFV